MSLRGGCAQIIGTFAIVTGCALASRWALSDAKPPVSWIVPTVSLAVLLSLVIFITRQEWVIWRDTHAKKKKSESEVVIENQYDELYRHIKRSRIEPVREYLDMGGDPNLQNGWTLLMVAAHFGTTQILTLLLDRGARLETAPQIKGLTALALAASAGKTKCVKILIERGAKLDVRPHGISLSTYIEYCGGPYPKIEKLLADATK